MLFVAGEEVLDREGLPGETLSRRGVFSHIEVLEKKREEDERLRKRARGDTGLEDLVSRLSKDLEDVCVNSMLDPIGKGAFR